MSNIASTSYSWSDLFSSSEDEDARYEIKPTDFQSDPEIELIEEEDETQYVEIKELMDNDLSTCDCIKFTNSDECLGYLKSLSFFIDFSEPTYKCNLNNILGIFDYFYTNHSDVNDPYRLACCDLFYRLRHEILFKLVCLSYNLNYEKSDVSFRDFNIDSDRTPDLIIDIEGTLLIVEISASSSFERSAVSKGLEEAGFESKYKKELDMLTDKNIMYSYCPILFDMSDTRNNEFVKMLDKLEMHFRPNSIYKSILSIVKDDLCMITLQVKNYLSAPASILFSKIIPIKPDHELLKSLYKTSSTKITRNWNYREVCVSIPTYNKIINNWHRLEDIISSCPFENNLNVYLDTSSYRILIDGYGGKSVKRELMKIVQDNDRLAFFLQLNVKVGKVFKRAVDSNDGVRYIVRSKQQDSSVKSWQDSQIQYLTSHEQSRNLSKFIKVEIDSYLELLENYFSYNYDSSNYDDSYEDKLVSMILENDLENKKGNYDNYKICGDVKFISDRNLQDIKIENDFKELIEKQVDLNTDKGQIPNIVKKNKSPFILPMSELTSSNYCSLKKKNLNLYEKVINYIEETDPYTTLILKKVIEEDFEFIRDKQMPTGYLNELKTHRSRVSREINQLMKKFWSETGGKEKLSKTKTEPYSTNFRNLNSEMKSVCKKITERSKIEGISNTTELIRLPTKNKSSNLGSQFLKEMTHYKNKKEVSTITGVGYRKSLVDDFNNDKIIFDNITSWMCDYAGDNRVKLMDCQTYDDVNLLKELKNLAINEYRDLIMSVQNSFLGHSAAFVSNFTHSLLYYSQMPFNSDYVRVDNLGYNNCLLIVKGGKKIFKSKASKMFRLLYPFNDCIEPWYKTELSPSSFEIIKIDGISYILTPWSQMHESILNDSISFYTRVCSFTILNLNPKLSLRQQFPKVSFNVMLSYHNRRQTEVMLANLRYILLATLGDYTGIMDIFKEFLGFNYDCFQSYIRSCILKNYLDYFNKLKEIKSKTSKTPGFRDYVKLLPSHLFTSSYIETEEELALMIYSTFLMTKAPYQRPAERARNLKGILEIHEYFDRTIGVNENIDTVVKKTSVILDDFSDLNLYTKKLFDNDFNYDPKYCSLLGNFADSYYKNKGLEEEIFTTWNNILNQSWDEMATSTGLRGKFDDLQNFWGQKGYFVVYKSLLYDKTFIVDLKKMLSIDLDIDKKRKLLRELNIIYKMKIDEPSEFLLFHAVDKVQWRGGREIYVMDIDTKTVQQPIEKFMGYLCGKLDNELISIPSDRRAQVIHHSIFEKDLPMKDTLTWYLTLDCTKWAPKSNYFKFLDTILSMTIIPPTFKTHFLNYTQKLFKKRIYFNSAEVEVLNNNSMYKKIVESYLIHDDVRKGYYLNMPYSWVMGIFNYTSSFLHALNQKYSSYIISRTSIESYNEETALFMFAHSDDSGGRLTCSNDFMASRALSLYELQLKMCNHLLSKKKSVISRYYFEILSVIYIFKKLLALLPKFLGGLRFLPSDKGAAQDMLASYSKCIEVMVSGASFNVAYIIMKMYSMMVYNFYNSTEVNEGLYRLPVQYMGMPDSHPLIVLLCGSDSDIARILASGGEGELVRYYSFFNKLINTIDDEGPIKPIKFKIQVRGIKKDFEGVMNDFKEFIETWSVANVNFHTTPFNFLSFLNKLNDPGFVGSLVNESTTRRLSRSFYMRKGKCINSTYGELSMEDLRDIVDSMLISIGPSKNSNFRILIPEDIEEGLENEIKLDEENSKRQIDVLKMTLSSPLKIMRYMDEISLNNKEIIQATRTLKPTHIELLKSPRTFSIKFDPAQMVSYIKEPDMAWALPNLRNMFSGMEEVKSLCEDCGFDIDKITPSTLLKLCRTYSNKHKKEIYMYSQIPGDIRQIKTYSSFLTFLSTNTFTNREIKGLVLNLKTNLTDPGYLPVNIDEDIYLINSCLSIIRTMMKVSGVEFLLGLTVKRINLINWGGGSIVDFIKHLANYSKDSEESMHYKVYLEYISDRLLDKFSSKTNASFLKMSSYYYFPKNQKSRGGWFGSGTLNVCTKKNVYSMELYNNLVVSMKSNVLGKIDKRDASYINDVLNKSGLSFSFNNKFSKDRKELVFGVDQHGDLAISRKIEMVRGIPAEGGVFISTPTDTCHFVEIEEAGSNSFKLCQNNELKIKEQKIYTLPLMQGEIINLIKMMFDPAEFERLVIEKGNSDFNDFILTEIMTEFGFDVFVNPKEFFDNFQASEIYRVFSNCSVNSISKLPTKPIINNLPAPEGSLLRILMDYTRVTGENILRTVNNLSPEIMSVRSQHPESMTAILSENLVKCHKMLYNESENYEIQNAYQDLCNSINDNDQLSIESNIIKLMTYWGYGSLVNALENYSVSKSDNNFWYFSLTPPGKIGKALYADLFVTLHKSICKTMAQNHNLYDNLSFPYKRIYSPIGGVFKVIDNMNLCLTFNLYKDKMILSRLSHYRISFINSLLAYMEDEDFILALNRNCSSNYVLCGIDFSYKNREKVIALYNTLMLCYYKTNSVGYDLNYTKRVDRLPQNVPNPISFYNKLKIEELEGNVPKFNVQYHNFLNDDIISELNSSFYMNSNNVDYRVSQGVGNPSNTSIPVGTCLPVDRVYNEEVFEDENWEEIISTLEMGDAEWEDIEEYFVEIEGKFKKLKTRRLNLKTPTVQTFINWVIDPYIQNSYIPESFYRQCGENIVVVTTEYIPNMSQMPNYQCRIVNFNRKVKRKDCKDFVLHISCVKELAKDVFWDKLIGGKKVDQPDSSVLERLYLNKFIISKDNIDHFSKAGKSSAVIFQEMIDKDRAEIEPASEPQIETDVEPVVNKEMTKEEYYKIVDDKLSQAVAEGIITNRLKKRIKERYLDEQLNEVYSIESLFKNLINEINIRAFGENVKSGGFSMKRDDYIKTFQSPVHFGMAHSFLRDDSKSIKNKKLNAELNSIYDKMSMLVASDTLSISEAMYMTVLKHYKLWIKVLKGTTYKKENKKFITLFFVTILNSAKVSDSSVHDELWQDIVNTYAGYLSDDGPESDDDEEDILAINTDFEQSARIKYRTSGH